MPVTRFGVSLEEETLEALDQYVAENNFANRSRALRFLIEKHLVEKKWMCDNIVAGVVTLVYQHVDHEIVRQSAEIQNTFHESVKSSQRYRLNEKNQMEVIVIQGASRILTALSDKLFSIKGIQHGKLTMSKA
jgi:CopG family transcriptional regulator, nickel-responsive regulator